ncbi:hypothetical protein HOG48_01980 [Candidatus Peregrinibacteria bacterium]|jgi:hypothetical protein|nr:hypothetical protein [Candidatus Peregrinibacteria bacterium]
MSGELRRPRRLEIIGDEGNVVETRTVEAFSHFAPPPEIFALITRTTRFRLTRLCDDGEPASEPEEYRVGQAEQIRAIAEVAGFDAKFFDPEGSFYMIMTDGRIEKIRSA